MAAGFMPAETGTEFSPCPKGCGHRDCDATHRRAEAICHHCDKPIGWEARFYDVGVPGKVSHVHALCEELAIEAEQKRRTT